MALASTHPADEFFSDCGIDHPPINIYQLAILCEIDIEFANLSSKSQGACFDFGVPINKTIVLNRNRDWEWRRRRFTAAHELRHALFHAGYSVGTTDARTISRIERDANSFAARLLVPDVLLERLRNGYGFLTAKMISEVFGVSYEAAAYRLFAGRDLNFRDRRIRREFKEKDLLQHKRILYMGIPDELRDWVTLKISANDGQKMMLPFCLRCGCVKLDEFPNVCWGCGKDTERYEGMPPTPIMRRISGDISNDDEAIGELLR